MNSSDWVERLKQISLLHKSEYKIQANTLSKYSKPFSQNYTTRQANVQPLLKKTKRKFIPKQFLGSRPFTRVILIVGGTFTLSLIASLFLAQVVRGGAKFSAKSNELSTQQQLHQHHAPLVKQDKEDLMTQLSRLVLQKPNQINQAKSESNPVNFSPSLVQPSPTERRPIPKIPPLPTLAQTSTPPQSSATIPKHTQQKRLQVNKPKHTQQKRLQVNKLKELINPATSADRWNELVSLGQARSNTIVPKIIAGSNLKQHSGEINIINRIPRRPRTSQYSTKEVVLGTSAAAKTIMPIIWSEEADFSQTIGRFAVELTEDVKAIDGTVALPAGSILITEVESVSQENHLVQQTVVALIYQDRLGKIIQAVIPPGHILIRGEDNKPLIAEGMNDPGGIIASQDILVGLLSGLAKIGELINQPREEITIEDDSDSIDRTTTRTTRDDPDIVAAALEGFFGVTSERLRERSDDIVEELLNRPNVLIVAQDSPVSIFFNSFVKISR